MSAPFDSRPSGGFRIITADERMADVGAEPPGDNARWVLADTTFTARADLEVRELVDKTWLVDDRELRIVSIVDEPMPEGCPDVPDLLPAGQRAEVCVAFLVSSQTPLKGIAVSDDKDTEGRQAGVFVPFTGGPTRPGVTTRERLRTGEARPLVVADRTVRASVVDLVPEPGAYFDYPIGLPEGSRAVMVRALVETDGEVPVQDLYDGLLLRDDRGQPTTWSYFSRLGGCTPARDGNGEPATAAGRVVVCALYVVPSGMPLASAIWFGSADDAESFLWEF